MRREWTAAAIAPRALTLQGLHRASSLTSGRPRIPRISGSRDHGTVVVVGLLILVVMMMLLGLSSMQTSVLEELMAGQSKQQNTAFHAAEAGMQAALSYLVSLRKPPMINKNGSAHIWPGCQVASPDSECGLLDPIIVSWKDFNPDAENAKLQGKAMSVLDKVGWSMNKTEVEPHFVIESRRIVNPDPTKKNRRYFFTVTAVGFDPGTNSGAVLQSTIIKEFWLMGPTV